MIDHVGISRRLALAIGWKAERIVVYQGACWIAHPVYEQDIEFDYRDWDVIGPIAEQFDCFPYRNFNGRWTTGLSGTDVEGSAAPQLAIALAVIKEAI